jgi:RNA polymerase sigma factor (sigma-70 family)
MSASMSGRAVTALRFRRDAALRSLAARGDAAAFAAVYERHHQALYRYCRSILHNDEDARDALQSAMTRAFAALRTETRDFELRPWLFRIAHNEAISLLRRRRDTQDLEAIEHAGADTLDRDVAQREELATLRADLDQLSEQQRAALVLRELNGLGHDEIAEVLGVTSTAVKAAVFDARSALHEFREGRAMECEAVRRVLSDRDGRALRGRKLRAHLRACRGCQDFLVGLERRPATLAALAPPLPAAASVALLAHLLPAGAAGSAATGSAAAGTAGSAVASGGIAGAAASTAASSGVAGTLAAKLAVTALVAAGAAGGAVAVTHHASGRHSAPPATAPAAAPNSAPGPAGLPTAPSARNGNARAVSEHPAAARHGRPIGAGHAPSKSHRSPPAAQNAMHRHEPRPAHEQRSQPRSRGHGTASRQPPAAHRRVHLPHRSTAQAHSRPATHPTPAQNATHRGAGGSRPTQSAPAPSAGSAPLSPPGKPVGPAGPSHPAAPGGHGHRDGSPSS